MLQPPSAYTPQVPEPADTVEKAEATASTARRRREARMAERGGEEGWGTVVARQLSELATLDAAAQQRWHELGS